MFNWLTPLMSQLEEAGSPQSLTPSAPEASLSSPSTYNPASYGSRSPGYPGTGVGLSAPDELPGDRAASPDLGRLFAGLSSMLVGGHPSDGYTDTLPTDGEEYDDVGQSSLLDDYMRRQQRERRRAQRGLGDQDPNTDDGQGLGQNLRQFFNENYGGLDDDDGPADRQRKKKFKFKSDRFGEFHGPEYKAYMEDTMNKKRRKAFEKHMGKTKDAMPINPDQWYERGR